MDPGVSGVRAGPEPHHHLARHTAPVPGSFAGLGLEEDAPERNAKPHAKKKEKERSYKPPSSGSGSHVHAHKPLPAPLPHLAARTVSSAPQIIKPEEEPFYKSAEASGVVADALARSRTNWQNGGVLQHFSSSSKSKMNKPVWQPPHHLAALGKFTVTIGPHIFEETTMWKVTWVAVQRAPPPPTPAKPQSVSQEPSVQRHPQPQPPAPSAGTVASIQPKLVSPALIAQLSKMSENDPALARVLRTAASGTASQAELQSLHRYITTLEEQQGNIPPASPELGSTVVANPVLPPQSPPASASPDQVRRPSVGGTTPVPGPSSLGAPRTSWPPASAGMRKMSSPVLPAMGNRPSSASATSMSNSASPPTTAYYPGMPRPSPPKVAYYPGLAPPKGPVNVTGSSSASQIVVKPTPSPAPSTSKPPVSTEKPKTRNPSLIMEFRDNPGERWLLPDLFAIDEASHPPPDGELALSFYIMPQAAVDSRGRPTAPPPPVKCTMRLQQLSQFSYDALLAMGGTVPVSKRTALWHRFDAAVVPPVFLQFRLPHATTSAAYQKAIEDIRQEELKRKGAPASSAMLSGLPGLAFPLSKKPKKPTSKRKVVSALKAPKGAKPAKRGSSTSKGGTPVPEVKDSTPSAVSAIEAVSPPSNTPGQGIETDHATGPAGSVSIVS